MWLTDMQKIGVALTTFGGLFMFLGVILFFDGALLALGNLLFLSGLFLIIGPQKTFYFFARKQKLRGTVCFLGGILLVFLKWPFFGVVLETFGFFNLFGGSTGDPMHNDANLQYACSDFFPVILTFLRQLPFVGHFLNLPYVRDVRPLSPPSLFYPSPRARPLTPPAGRGPHGGLTDLCSMTSQ
ncbi:hypothetical protein EVG20_g5201 [Dentipellis fragilis]|uniref:Vesicle transport protein n=1 Tax=Dentipellis fragilis TaxID=205917 RepID=A0A4Y9YVX9_9AGAM|nr:hypothetical protein EVG20_g5201 [Dentipellis fragilis]